MAPENAPRSSRAAWALARRQHWVITLAQLIALGFSEDAIRHRLRTGRLHRVHAGVYAVGRGDLSAHGRLLAAVLACGAGAALSHDSAAELWEIRPRRLGLIEVSVPRPRQPRRPGIRVHRRATMPAVVHRRGIPITTPAQTLADLSGRLSGVQLERAVNEAINRDLTDPDRLREDIRGAPRLALLLDRHTFRMSDSVLEQRFLAIVRRAGLPLPETQARVNGFRVDFFWPDLGLVVETDGLRFHRTPAQQAADHRRDQAHIAAGLTPLRFTHAQIFHEPPGTAATLAAVAARLGAGVAA